MDRRLKKDARIQLFKKKTYHFNVKYIGFYFNKKKKKTIILMYTLQIILMILYKRKIY